MTKIDKVLYTSKVHITGGRDSGTAKSDDGRLDIGFAIPGSTSAGTNPEQLLAAGWSACFFGAMSIAAQKRNVSLPPDRVIDAEIDLGTSGSEFVLAARLRVTLPGMDRQIAQTIVEAAHNTCPYSKALRGNIEIVVTLA